jgi:hypothetical protein
VVVTICWQVRPGDVHFAMGAGGSNDLRQDFLRRVGMEDSQVIETFHLRKYLPR